MARGQPYLAAQIMSKYGKRQVASVESYTEIFFCWPAGLALCKERELVSHQGRLFEGKMSGAFGVFFRAKQQSSLYSAKFYFESFVTLVVPEAPTK